MISDPNYNLPKDAFIRLFDNPIPAGDPARSDAPEWAQDLDEVVVWAHMGDNGQVTVFVNGEEAGGGGGAETFEIFSFYAKNSTSASKSITIPLRVEIAGSEHVSAISVNIAAGATSGLENTVIENGKIAMRLRTSDFNTITYNSLPCTYAKQNPNANETAIAITLPTGAEPGGTLEFSMASE